MKTQYHFQQICVKKNLNFSKFELKLKLNQGTRILIKQTRIAVHGEIETIYIF